MKVIVIWNRRFDFSARKHERELLAAGHDVWRCGERQAWITPRPPELIKVRDSQN